MHVHGYPDTSVRQLVINEAHVLASQLMKESPSLRSPWRRRMLLEKRSLCQWMEEEKKEDEWMELIGLRKGSRRECHLTKKKKMKKETTQNCKLQRRSRDRTRGEKYTNKSVFPFLLSVLCV